ncbi:MAG: Ni/Fe hydrogenase subunit alpha [Phycisphaerae bacterium]
MKNVTIDVHEVTRVEGHGNLSVRVADGAVTRIELQITESPRYFEAFLRGRPAGEAPQIACRICGICSVGHATAAVQAIEAATGVEPSAQTLALRRLLLLGEHLQSHVLHLYFLAVPDFLGVGSVIPLAATHGDVVRRALRLKKLANDLCKAVGGRHIHPIAMHVGGFTHLPADDELIALKRRLESARVDLEQTVELFATLAVPELSRNVDYVALAPNGDGAYPLRAGPIRSTRDPRPTPAARYRERVIETVVPHSAAKHCHTPGGETYAVGSLARFNNNSAGLHPAAAAAARRLGLTAPCRNPFHNNTAQLVECVHIVESAIELIDALLTRGLRREPLAAATRCGAGVGAVEVPRGLLFHEYEVDASGRIVAANLIIPTGQNLANIEEDLRAFVPQLLEAGLGPAEITLRLEMLIRAYDPCISCATHFLEIDWR